MSKLDAIQNKIKEEKAECEVQLRRLRAEFNRQLAEEVASTENDIMNNYNMGMIEVEEMVQQKIDNLKYHLKTLYKYETL
mgnify:CR=1 FL=1